MLIRKILELITKISHHREFTLVKKIMITNFASCGFSENMLKRNSASCRGRNVDGTKTYSPGGSEYLELISLSLVNDFVMAVAFVASKNRLSKRSLELRKSSGT